MFLIQFSNQNNFRPTLKFQLNQINKSMIPLVRQFENEFSKKLKIFLTFCVSDYILILKKERPKTYLQPFLKTTSKLTQLPPLK
ncbi:hypothetical protein ABM34_08415 [Companilactobacillus ginsenosidimutans]|uniref:Uncharacterized protein n=1 Tax=Companilactobacillus ginsenosidimutans TaxID=1007676 RepID=A0A0H4QGL7_9LACO|nr:hypothetical protein ABM34_08415 [Companilactobacillus ginsenosidimutans]